MYKVKYLLSNLFLICSLSIFAQHKHDSKIIVPTDTAGLFNRIVKHLYKDGYAIEQKDESNGFILTKEKSLKSGSASVKFKFLIGDSSLIVTGDAASDLTISIYGVKAERTFEIIDFSGMKGSMQRKAWEEMLAVAREFGSNISYSK
jgi:hypothetical protein